MTDRKDAAAEEFISSEMETAGRTREGVSRFAEEMLEAAAATPWGRAFIRSRAQQLLGQHLRIETNGALPR